MVGRGDSVRQLWWLPRSLSLADVSSMTTAAASMARDVVSTMLVKLEMDTLPLLDTLYHSPHVSSSQQQLKPMLLSQSVANLAEVLSRMLAGVAARACISVALVADVLSSSLQRRMTRRRNEYSHSSCDAPPGTTDVINLITGANRVVIMF